MSEMKNIPGTPDWVKNQGKEEEVPKEKTEEKKEEQ